MSKHETPLTLRYWEQVGGTLIEEFTAVKSSPTTGKRLMDAVIVLDGEKRRARPGEIDLKGKDIIVAQTKAKRLGMYLMGQALFSKHLMEKFEPASIRSVAICVKGDEVWEPSLKRYDIELVVFDD